MRCPHFFDRTADRSSARSLRGVAAAAVVLAAAAAGCSSDEPEEKIEIESSPGARASGGQAPSKAPKVEPVPEEPTAQGFTRGLDAAMTPEEKAVTQAWFGFREESHAMLRDADPNEVRLKKFGGPAAVDVVTNYVRSMQQAGTKHSGGTIASVESVSIDGASAVVESCFRTDQVEVTKSGKPVEEPVRTFKSRDTLAQVDGGWRVMSMEAYARHTPCTYR